MVDKIFFHTKHMWTIKRIFQLNEHLSSWKCLIFTYLKAVKEKLLNREWMDRIKYRGTWYFILAIKLINLSMIMIIIINNLAWPRLKQNISAQCQSKKQSKFFHFYPTSALWISVSAHSMSNCSSPWSLFWALKIKIK